MMITCVNVTKAYGKARVLQGISMEFAQGQIHGLIGRNGSGKTMLLKCMCGLVPFDGEITVGGLRVGRDVEIPDDIGAIIDSPGFLPNYSGFKNLSLIAGIRGRASRERIETVIRAVGLEPGDRKHVSKYSMGMRQRLAIAQAIMEEPSILILDEPMNGLDNSGVREIRGLLKNLRAQGKTILIASHNPLDIDELCDTVCEMDAGMIVRKR